MLILFAFTLLDKQLYLGIVKKAVEGCVGVIKQEVSMQKKHFFKRMVVFVGIVMSFVVGQAQAASVQHDPKRLLIISDIYEHSIGGTERVIAEIKVRLERRGMRVLVADFSKITTFQMPGTSGEPSPYPWRVKSEIAQMIKNFSPDYILIVPLGMMSYKAAEYCAENDIPFSIFYSVRMPELCKKLFYLPLTISRHFEYTLLSRATTILVPTLSFRNELTDSGLDNVFAWPHGVDLETFTLPTPEEKEAATIACNLQCCERPFYLFVGHISKAKNLDVFFDMNLPGTKVVVGDENIGYTISDLRKRYPEIVFAGPKMGKDLLNYYACSDVFVFPSKNDSFGLVMTEGLASGLPVVGFDTTGPGDVVPRGCGVSYLANSDEGLQAAAIQAWVDLRQGVVTSMQCRKYASRYSWDSAVDDFLNKLEQINSLPNGEHERRCWCC